MGVSLMGSRSSYDESSTPKPSFPNPDPRKFKIEKSSKLNSILIILINYEGCTNYEGNKILVFKDIEIDDLKRQGSIDPHFSENKEFHSPIARFEPTARGWGMAHTLAYAMAAQEF